MKWESLISTRNLKLAWRRINTGVNVQYKRFFRESYLVYESAVNDHIKELHQKLKAKAWEANHAKRLYLPKPSGLQRPISLLEIEDQIVLQAVANLFANKLSAKRKKVELKTVFSNKLETPKSSIFFIENWQKTYRVFQEKCIDVFNQGFEWSVAFDLSAYYDTISHELLLSVESQKNSEPTTKEIVKKWLKTWSAEDPTRMTGHGIPQGPIASAFLSEIFFLPIDIKLQKASFKYLRYCDDIRLFGKSENEVREAAILLEQECRHNGLIPQSKKFSLRKLQSPEEAMGALPSIPPIDGKDASERFMSTSEAHKILAPAIDGRPQKIKDKSRFRYVMFRAPADPKILDVALRLLPRHPEHIDAFVAYFRNYDKKFRIAKEALNYLESGVPYSYVRGELWHVVARLARVKEIQRGLPIARKDAKNRSCCVALSWGVMHFLMKYEEERLTRNKQRLVKEDPISRSLLAPIFNDREFLPNGHAITLLKGTLMEQLAGARELQRRQVTLESLNLQQKNLEATCNRSLKALGVIRRQHRHSTDWIGKTLKSLYGCMDVPIWRELLDTEYEHAHQLMIEANYYFFSARSPWLSSQNSFNEVVVRKLFDFFKFHDLPGHSKTVDKNGEIVRYGALVSEGTPFDTKYPTVATVFRTIQNRRSKLPGQHPYSAKGGERNTWLTKKEQNKLIPKIKNAFDSIANIVQQTINK